MRYPIYSMIVFLVAISSWGQAIEPMSLAGEWSFRLDPKNEGIDAKWFDAAFPETVKLPGSMDENGKGTPVTKMRVEYLTRLYECVGPAWYQKEVTVPQEWAGKRIVLFLERCHWETQVWVDGKLMGMEDSLCTPHVHDLSTTLTPGPHKIALRIDNSVKYTVGLNAHSITEHTQTNWNGVVGRIELQATDPVWIESTQVFPKVADKSALIRVKIANMLKDTSKGRVTAAACGKKAEKAFAAKPGETSEIEIPLVLGDEARLWDEFSPNLIDLSVSLKASASGKSFTDTRSLKFGLREVGKVGTQFAINGRPTFLRGNLECCIFPLTGYPPTDVNHWLRIFRTAREYGLNHIRFHSWCPPESAFCAADQLGLTFHIETPVWTELGTDQALDDYVYAESDRILEAYGNHPSFCMMAVGNEPSGPNKDAFLSKIVAYWKQKDSRRAYTTCAGWPELPGSDYHVLHARNGKPIRLHGGGPLGPTTAFDYSENIAGCDVPIVAHELGQWCVYPNYDEIAKYTGTLRARNFESFRDSLAAHHMAGMDKAFSKASGMLQLLLYKADMEAVLRTKGAGGYQLLALQDFPGQGSALEGFVDAFWDSKGYVTPEQFREFCSETVPLARLEKFTFTTDEIMRTRIDIAHFGKEPLKDVVARWVITRGDGGEVDSGEWKVSEIPIGNGTVLGNIAFNLNGIDAPGKFNLTVSLKDTPFKNHWNFWVYPAKVETSVPDDILIATDLDEKVEKTLKKGGKVLLLPTYLAPAKSVKSAFESIFWNTQWFPGQNRQLGILCEPVQAALSQFPNDGYTDWQWWDLLNGSRVLRLDDFPPDFEPLVRVIDDWNRNCRLGVLFEATVGSGRLLVCTLDIQSDLDKRPAAAALRRSLIGYMDRDAFAPKYEIDLETLRPLFQKPAMSVVRVDSQARGYEGENAVDGNPATIWHTPWEKNPAPYPHELVMKLRDPLKIKGMTLVPRQDIANAFINEYEVYVSKDGKDWGKPAAQGNLKKDAQTKEIAFDKARTGQYIKFIAKSGHDGQCFCAIAELEPVSGK